MNILLVHNFYQQSGGEDVVFSAEAELLSAAGHRVHRYTVSNDEIGQLSTIGLAARTIWNAQQASRLAALVKTHKIDIVHFHNTFPLLSPAVYGAVRSVGAATVQTLHNYRLLCANALLFREGHVCEQCLGRVPVPAVQFRCYRGSLGASATVATMQVVHRALGTYRRQVDAFIALTDFARDKFVEGGLPKTRLYVKPNFLNTDPGLGSGGGGYALFIGRLTPEKGVRTLLNAWQELGSLLPLKLLGEGPLASEVAQAASTLGGVEWLGQRPKPEVLEVAKAAEVLIFPSEWYEGFPMTLVEALAVGLPVIASRVGSMQSLIAPGRTGFHFTPGDSRELAAQVHTFLAGDRLAMRQAARSEFLNHYSSVENLKNLMYIYGQARLNYQDGRSRTEPRLSE